MPTRASLELIYFLTKLCRVIAPAYIPLKFITPNKVSLEKQTIQSQSFYFVIFFLQITSSLFPIFEFFYSSTNHNITLLVFHGFLMVCYITTIAVYITYRNSGPDICCLLNSLLSQPNGLVGSLYRKRSRQSNGVTYLGILMSPTIYAIFFVFVPTLVIAFPCLYGSSLYVSLLGPCSSYHFQAVVFLINIICMTPFGICGPMVIICNFVKLKELMENLLDLKYLLSQANITSQMNSFDIGLRYRRLQLFAMLCNKCYQLAVWPVVEFLCSLLMIIFLYTLLVFDSFMTVHFRVAIIVVFIVDFSILCFIFDMGRRSFAVSTCILIQLRRDNFGGKWGRMFCSSCKPIALKVGCFHAMDRERVPSILRYVSQRTIFLVLKTNEGGFAGNLVVSLPS